MKPVPPFLKSGNKLGRLTLLSLAIKSKDGHARWLCKCDCGRSTIVSAYSLKIGDTISCGCYHYEKWRDMAVTHGMSKTKTYAVWQDMMSRCRNPKSRAYKHYGKRGIKVCKSWHKFKGFLNDMGTVPPGKTLGRINNSGGYLKSNCRWETRKQQSRNTRRNRITEINGIKKCSVEWIEQCGLKRETFNARLRYGWSGERLLIPARKIRI